MEKTMEPLVLRTDDEVIWLEQHLSDTVGHQGIAVSIDQVPLLIEWLQEAAQELQANQELQEATEEARSCPEAW
jgi:hypothetical protein